MRAVYAIDEDGTTETVDVADNEEEAIELVKFYKTQLREGTFKIGTSLDNIVSFDYDDLI